MNANICDLLFSDAIARNFVLSVSRNATFVDDSHNLGGVSVVDKGKGSKCTLPGGARFDYPRLPTERAVLKQTATYGDSNKLFLCVIGLIFSSSDLEQLVRSNSPGFVADDYFREFHVRIECAKIGTQEEVHAAARFSCQC